MISIKFILQNMATKERQDTIVVYFNEWDETVSSLVDANRKRFEDSMPQYRVLTLIEFNDTLT
jgi:hypothetical protein